MSPTVMVTSPHLLMSTGLNFIPLLKATSSGCNRGNYTINRKKKNSESFLCVCVCEKGLWAALVCVFMWDVLLKVSVYCVLKWSLLDLHRTTEHCWNIYHPQKLSLCPTSPDQSSGLCDPRLLPPPASLSGLHDQTLVAAFVLFPL